MKMQNKKELNLDGLFVKKKAGFFKGLTLLPHLAQVLVPQMLQLKGRGARSLQRRFLKG